MLIKSDKRGFCKLGTLAVGALALGMAAVPLTAKAQVYFDVGPVGVGIAGPAPYYYHPWHHHYYGPGYYYGPYGYDYDW